MALGLNTESGGGDYTPVAKYDARAGRFFRIDRTQDAAGNWVTNDVDITTGFQAVFDFENIEIGWVLFAAGVAPSWSLAKYPGQIPPRPSENHKQCFRLMMKLGKSSGGDVREFASQAKAVIGAVDALHTQYEEQKAANPGKLPVVTMTGTTAIKTTGKGQTSTNYAPNFEITKWVDRPAELIGGQPANEPKAEPVQQMKTTSQTVAAPAADDDEEF